MKTRSHFRCSSWMLAACLAFVCVALPLHVKSANASISAQQETVRELGNRLKVGDVVFIRVTPLPFKKVASTTQSWTNHVGIVVDSSGGEPIIAESTFPRSRTTTLSRFTERSDKGRIAIARLDLPLTEEQLRNIERASNKRLGVFYDTGFNLHSNRQFCSRFVREVLAEATGVTVGEVETFKTLLTRNPDTDLMFWRMWYFGNIPWQRETVTPASLLQSAHLKLIFDGYAG